MLKRLHNFWLGYGRLLILVFICFSLVAIINNVVFKIGIGPKDQTALPFHRAQFYSAYTTPDFTKLATEDFNKAREFISLKSADKSYRIFFVIDCIWAFLLMAVIYNYTSSLARFKKPAYLLLTLLILAYLFDILENLSYLSGADILVLNLKIFNTLKLLFLALGILYAIIGIVIHKFSKPQKQLSHA